MATREDAIKENLAHYCFETDSHEFTGRNITAVNQFVGYLQTKRVVDLGCGDGAAHSTFHENNVKYLGVDINSEKLKKHKGKTIKADMYTWLTEQPSDSVDNIFTHHSLEHLAEPDEVLSEISRVLKPGGLCCNTVPYGGELGGGHFSTFTEAEQLLPKGFEVVYQRVDTTGYPEIMVIGKKCKN